MKINQTIQNEQRKLKFRVRYFGKDKVHTEIMGNDEIYLIGIMFRHLYEWHRETGLPAVIEEWTGRTTDTTLKDEIYEGDYVLFDVYGSDGEPPEYRQKGFVKCKSLGRLYFGKWKAEFCHNVKIIK